jgi:hypothetical protein
LIHTHSRDSQLKSKGIVFYTFSLRGWVFQHPIEKRHLRLAKVVKIVAKVAKVGFTWEAPLDTLITIYGICNDQNEWIEHRRE